MYLLVVVAAAVAAAAMAARLPAGATCTADAECASGVCADFGGTEFLCTSCLYHTFHGRNAAEDPDGVYRDAWECAKTNAPLAPPVGPPPGRGARVPGVDAAVRALLAWQHNVDCNRAQLARMMPRGASGIDSHIHTAGWALAHAIRSNRVLIDTGGSSLGGWLNESWCDGTRRLTCIFEPMSACDGLAYATRAVPVEDTTHPGPKALRLDEAESILGLTLPPRERAAAALIDPNLWWACVVDAVLFRPNDALRSFYELALANDALFENARALRRAPLVAVHVRRGDKRREARLIDPAEYARLVADALPGRAAVLAEGDDEDALRALRAGCVLPACEFAAPRFPHPVLRSVGVQAPRPYDRMTDLLHNLLTMHAYVYAHPVVYVATLTSNQGRWLNEARLLAGDSDRTFVDATPPGEMRGVERYTPPPWWIE